MRKHASSPYNPNIAHVFYLAGFIESWGRGIEKICSACEKDGVPQPVYTINPGDIMIEFTAPEDRIIRSVTHKVTDRVTEKVTDRLDAKSIQILTLISEDPAYTSTTIAEKLSVSRKTVSQKLKEMKEKDIIERDDRDMHRETSPLKQADDAVLLDSSDLDIDGVVEEMKKIIKKAE